MTTASIKIEGERRVVRLVRETPPGDEVGGLRTGVGRPAAATRTMPITCSLLSSLEEEVAGLVERSVEAFETSARGGIGGAGRFS